MLRSSSRDRYVISLKDNGSFPFYVDLFFLYQQQEFYINSGVCLITNRNFLPFVSTWVHPWLLVGSVLLTVLVVCAVSYFVFVLCLVCPMLAVSLGCPLGFSNVYLAVDT